MKTVIKTLLVLALLGAVGAVSVVTFGLYNVSARSGHLPGVSWVLHTTYRNSVKRRAPPASEVPDLDDPDLVALGAGHFDSACAFCHAVPGDLKSATASAMSPEPPHITEAVADWEPQHLFVIVKDGVKMSGMPFWPATREDEVWAMVAFLRRVGDMDADSYAALAQPQADTDDPVLGYCATCHGLDGNSGNGHIPRLDILTEDYMARTLAAYRSGARNSGFMAHASREVPAEDLERMARHFATTPVAVATSEAAPDTTDEALREAGATLAGFGTDDIPSCASCHGPDLETFKPGFPAIAGQRRAYLGEQLKLWRDGARGGGERQDLMQKAARSLDDDDIAALAAYYAQLPARRPD